METGKKIHHKMCRHGGEHMVNAWILNDKSKKTPVPFLVDGCECETKTVYQFHGCHWHGHTCLKNHTKRQQKRYKDMRQIDRLIKNNGWDTKYNLVSTLECEEPILKRYGLKKSLHPFPQFIVYDFESILAPLNEHPTDDLTCLSRHIPIRVAVHDTLRKEPVHLVYENPRPLIEQFIDSRDRKARSNSDRCFKTTSISFRFSNASRHGERTMEAMG